MKLRYEQALWKLGFQRVAGVDEVGLGPWAGPVFASAVILKETRFRHRVDDSKALTPLGRTRAFWEILSKGWVGVGIVPAGEVDSIGVREAARRAFRQALEALPKPPDAVLVDGPVRIGVDLETRNIIRGDQKSLSIAAASIVAKVLRDRMMGALEEIFPGYGFDRHKGYGTAFHRRALKELGPSPLHRMSFKPLQSLPFPTSPTGR